MKKLFKVSFVLMAVLMAVGSAWAWDDDEHVSQAPNGKGDVLIIPQYFAFSGGWKTRVTVINTCLTESVVAKVVIRSGGFTKELLDFFIFLTPADVWEGDIYYGAAGPMIYSTDDSVIARKTGTGEFEFASLKPLVPFQANFVDPCANDTVYGIPGDMLGYIEIIEAWNYDNIYTDSKGVDHDFGKPGLKKTALMEAFFDATGFAYVNSGGTFSDPYDFDETANVLAGHYEIFVPSVNGSDGYYSANQATILQNFNINTAIGIGLETRLTGVNSENSLCEVEAALSKNRVAMPYYGITSGEAFTLGWMTFPTKYTQVNASCAVTGVLSPFFSDPDNYVATDENPYSVEYGLKYFDLSENTTSSSEFTSPVTQEEANYFPYEVNYIPKFFEITYPKGWANIEFADGTGQYQTVCHANAETTLINEIGFTGAPAIPTTMFWFNGGLEMMKAAYHDGFVYYNDLGVTKPFSAATTIYQPLYQVDWTKTGFYTGIMLCDTDEDGSADDSCSIFCEDRPLIPGCTNYIP